MLGPMWRIQAGLVLAVALVGLASCRSVVVRERPGLRVEAPDARSAERWLAEAEALRARILAELSALGPAARGRTLDARPIRILEASEADRWHELVLGSADTRARVVRLRSDDPDLELTLSHELAHLCLGSEWTVLPAAVQEGLADLLGARALDALPRIRARRADGLLWAFGGLSLRVTWRLPGASAERIQARTELGVRPPEGAAVPDPAASPVEWLDRRDSFTPKTIDPTRDPFCYGVGYVLAERVVARAGLPALRQLCAEAVESGSEQVPASRLFELGGLAPAAHADFGTLAQWLRETWDEPTQRAWLEWRAEPLAPALAEALHGGERAPGSTPEERRAELERWEVAITVAFEGLPAEAIAPVWLRDVPALCARLSGEHEP
jgi:hypothetical protein